MSYRDFLESRDSKWVWYRTLAFFGVVVCAITGYVVVRSVLPTDEPVAAEPPELPSPTPNGGLVAVEGTLQWEDAWDGELRDWPDVTLSNPTNRDLHVSIDHEACPLGVHPKEFTVPAGEQVTLEVGSNHPRREFPSSRDAIADFALPFTVKIAEFPGTHPGWNFHARVHRALAIDEVRQNKTFRVIPLRPISGIAADIGGESVGVEVTGPHYGGYYLVQIDPKVLVAAKERSDYRDRQLRVRADVDGVHRTEQFVYLQL